MKKRALKTLIMMCGLCLLPMLGIAAFVWYDDYQESRNDFTPDQVCQIKAGMDIDTALTILNNPREYHVYNFSNVYSAQYRNLSKGYFLEIVYSPDEASVIDIFWGQGRTKTVAQSGICAVGE